MLKSYYEILGVKPDSTKSEIKNKFRKLVRMYHPDVNSSLEAEKIFKEINKAAEVLLDDTKRKNYDLLRSANKKVYSKPKYDKNSSNYTFSDLFSRKNKKEEKKEKPLPKNGEDINVSVSINYQEALLGTTRIINVATSTICPKCSGYKFANGKKCEFCDGLGEKTITKKITVKIPASIKNKAKLRIKNEGKEGLFGGKNGDIYIIVNIEATEELKIKDNIVYYDAQISPYTAILGGNVKVPTLWGEATIKIPPLTKANQTFKLIDVGVLNEKTNKKGEQIVNIIIQIPSSISSEEYSLYEKLKDINLKKKNAKFI